jgi:hypothetical protein
VGDCSQVSRIFLSTLISILSSFHVNSLFFFLTLDNLYVSYVFSGSHTMFTLTHLDPTLRYDFRVQAWNSAGPSEWAEVHNIKCGKEPCNMLSLAQLASEAKHGVGMMMTYNKTNSKAPLVVMPHSSLAVDSSGKHSDVDSGSVPVPIVDKKVDPAVSIFYTMYELFNSAAAVGSTISIVIAGILITRKVYISSGRGTHKPDGINAKELKNYSKIGQGCFICEKQFGTFTSRRHNCGKSKSNRLNTLRQGIRFRLNGPSLYILTVSDHDLSILFLHPPFISSGKCRYISTTHIYTIVFAIPFLSFFQLFQLESLMALLSLII